MLDKLPKQKKRIPGRVLELFEEDSRRASEGSDLRRKVLRLAKARPELRKHLIPLLRKRAASPTVDGFLTILASRLSRYDQKLQKRQPNDFRLSHFLGAVTDTGKMIPAKYRKQDTPEALGLLKRALQKNFVLWGRKFELPPVNAVVKMIDAWVDSGKMPKL